MVKYHETKKGGVAMCRASVKPCPLGEAGAFHADSREAVEKHIEASNASKAVPSRKVSSGQDKAEIGKYNNKGWKISASTYSSLPGVDRETLNDLYSDERNLQRVEHATEVVERQKAHLEHLYRENYHSNAKKFAQLALDRAVECLRQAQMLQSNQNWRPQGYEDFPDVDGVPYERHFEASFGPALDFQSKHGVTTMGVHSILRVNNNTSQLSEVMGYGQAEISQDAKGNLEVRVNRDGNGYGSMDIDHLESELKDSTFYKSRLNRVNEKELVISIPLDSVEADAILRYKVASLEAEKMYNSDVNSQSLALDKMERGALSPMVAYNSKQRIRDRVNAWEAASKEFRKNEIMRRRGDIAFWIKRGDLQQALTVTRDYKETEPGHASESDIQELIRLDKQVKSGVATQSDYSIAMNDFKEKLDREAESKKRSDERVVQTKREYDKAVWALGLPKKVTPPPMPARWGENVRLERHKTQDMEKKLF